jgi:hypothetical protein
VKIVIHIACALGLALGWSTGVIADGAGPFTGKWTNVVVLDGGDVGPGCRFIEVVTRTYSLKRNADGAAVGSYILQHERQWIAKTNPECQLPGQNNLPDGFFRNDGWSVLGKLTSNGQMELSAVHLQCVGDCEGLPVIETFRTVLRQAGNAILDLSDGDPAQALVFANPDIQAASSRSADSAFRSLLQPLMDRNCNKFFRDSLDPSWRLSIVVPEDSYCRAVDPMGVILSGLTTDAPRYSIAVTVGAVTPTGTAVGVHSVLLAQEVIVRRFFSAPDGSGGIYMGAVLRRQPNGTWKIHAIL